MCCIEINTHFIYLHFYKTNNLKKYKNHVDKMYALPFHRTNPLCEYGVQTRLENIWIPNKEINNIQTPIYQSRDNFMTTEDTNAAASESRMEVVIIWIP